MLEWMHDPSVVEKMRSDFASKSIADCEEFIRNSISDDCVNYAVADDSGLYMGTVSLKNIREENAEFAIVVHPDAMGKGYSAYAMKTIIEKGFRELELKRIYWCVAPDNKRAIRFYDKNGYVRVKPETLSVADSYSEEEKRNYLWYEATKVDTLKV